MYLLRWDRFLSVLKLLILLLNLENSGGKIMCPSFKEIPHCSCFLVDDQLMLQCSGSDIQSTKKSLQLLDGPVKSFSIYDLDPKHIILPNGLTNNVTSAILHLQISHSSLEKLEANSLGGISKSLESLSLISGQLKTIPLELQNLRRLRVLDLESNQIPELEPYIFHNLHLVKLNLKGNQIENVSDFAFWGLEESLSELNLEENKLKSVPMSSIARLKLLKSINLAWNEIDELWFGDKNWPLLRNLNINSNYISRLDKGVFRGMKGLRRLSINLNSISHVEEGAFEGNFALESIDLSFNKIKILGTIFRDTPRIVSLDLSNNYINILINQFNNLTELRELFLNGNNIVQLPSGLFYNCPRVNVIYLQDNALIFVESNSLSPLKNLTEIRLSNNFLRIIPRELFLHNFNLVSVSLDSNLLDQIEGDTFQNCDNLRELRLQNNFIRTFQWKGPRSLEELYLENNLLYKIVDLGSFKKLHHITISKNDLQKLTFEMLPTSEVSSISLGNNKIELIENLAFKNQSSLLILFLGFNNLYYLQNGAFFGLVNLERLYLGNNNITTIDNDCFTNGTRALRFLDLKNNKLRSINRSYFQKLSQLSEINLSHNKIDLIEEGAFKLKSLRILDLSNNHLVSFKHQFGVEILKLSSNFLSELHINSIKMIDLDVKENKLNAFSIQNLNLQNLQNLQLSSNNMSSLSRKTFSSFPKLTYLSCQSCQIGRVVDTELFANNLRLSVLRLSDNIIQNIQDGAFLNLTGLRELHLRFNKFNFFPYGALINSTKLEVLTIGGNNIETLDLRNLYLPRLKQLDLSVLGLRQIFVSAPSGNGGGGGEGGLSRSLPILDVIDLSENDLNENSLSEFFFGNLSITNLDLGSNSLREIPYAALSQLRLPFVLNVSANPLKQLNPRSEHEPSSNINYFVMDLFLCDNNISSISQQDFKLFPNLHRLVVQKTKISIIQPNTFAYNKKLNLLDISINRIDISLNNDSFQGLTQLKSLNLSQNKIKIVSGFNKDLSGLQELDLSYNEITLLEADAFLNLISLVSVSLRGNFLSVIPTLFGPQSRLNVLDLSMNYIEFIAISVLRHLETRVSDLKITENPFNCCESKDFWNFLLNHPKIFSSKRSDSNLQHRYKEESGSSSFTYRSILAKGVPNFICDSPESLRGRPMQDSELARNNECSNHAIVKLAIQDVRPSSAIVSWIGRNNSGMNGFMIAYQALGVDDIIRTRPLPASSRVYLLPDLESNTDYLVCVLGLQNQENASTASALITTRSASTENLLRDSSQSKCTKVRTLNGPLSSAESMPVLQRRFGLVLGSSISAVLFIALMISVICFKLRKRQVNKRQQNNLKEEVINNTAANMGNNFTTATTLTLERNQRCKHNNSSGGTLLRNKGGMTGTLSKNNKNSTSSFSPSTSPDKLQLHSPQFLNTYHQYSPYGDCAVHHQSLINSENATEMDRL